MLKIVSVTGLFAGLSLLGAASAQAMPTGGTIAPGAAVEQVIYGDGCGPRRVRGPYGGCRWIGGPRFYGPGPYWGGPRFYGPRPYWRRRYYY